VLMSRTCLVTGGAGFIGCAISEGLVNRFDRVVVIDNLHPQVHKKCQRPTALDAEAELMIADVTRPATWADILKTCKPSALVHLAAETGTGQSLSEAARHASVNVVGTATMLDALAHFDCIPERIVLASSRAVYGEGPWRRCASEEILYPGQRTREQLAAAEWDFPDLEPLPASAATTMPNPVSVYGATKLAQENIIKSWAYAFGVSPVILRLQNVYGPGQSLNNPYTGIVSLFCRLARNGEVIPLYEDGRMLRDFVPVDDVASALLAAISADREMRMPLDVGTGVASSIADIAHRIAAMYGAPEPAVCAKYRFGDVRHASCSIGPTREVLSWAPGHGIDSGLSKLQTWIEEQLNEEIA